MTEQYNAFDSSRLSVQMFNKFLYSIDDLAADRDYWKQQYEEIEKEYRQSQVAAMKHADAMMKNLVKATISGILKEGDKA